MVKNILCVLLLLSVSTICYSQVTWSEIHIPRTIGIYDLAAKSKDTVFGLGYIPDSTAYFVSYNGGRTWIVKSHGLTFYSTDQETIVSSISSCGVAGNWCYFVGGTLVQHLEPLYYTVSQFFFRIRGDLQKEELIAFDNQQSAELLIQETSARDGIIIRSQSKLFVYPTRKDNILYPQERLASFDFADTLTLMLGTDKGLYSSSDVGNSWETMRDVLGSVLAVAHLKNSTWLVRTNSGQWRTDDFGSHWKKLDRDTINWKKIEMGERVGIAITDNALYSTSDTGRTWQVLYDNPSESMVKAVLGDDTTYYLLTNKHFLRSPADPTASVKSIAQEKPVLSYPQVVHDYLTLDASLIRSAHRIVLYNSVGSIVQDVAVLPGSSTISLNCTRLNSGLYWLAIDNTTRKVLITK